MKKMRHFISFVLAMVMVLAMSMSVMAATITKEEGVTGAASITVNLPKVKEGATADNTYEIYKVFDATTKGDAISYKLVPGVESLPVGFTTDTEGNIHFNGEELSSSQYQGLIKYVYNNRNKMLVATVDTTAADESFTVAELPYGYYFIRTTTGSFVTVDSTTPHATVNDKNTVPELDKKITGASSYDDDGKKALAQVGTVVNYEATITVGKGMLNYTFHDKMSPGLTFNPDSVVLVPADCDGQVVFNPQDGDTFDVVFTRPLAEGTEIKIQYSATINENALTDDPENNTAYLSYGDSTSENKTPNSETKTWNAQISVVKKDGNNTDTTDDDTTLANAGFKLKNSEGKYYHLNTTGAEPVVEWKDDIAAGDEHTSGVDGTVPAFTGLADGTYTLVETTVPDGYNKSADTTIVIKAGDYTAENLEKEVTVINNKGAELPSTGGIGTTMFYVIGGALVLVAVVLLVTRKRMSVEK